MTDESGEPSGRGADPKREPLIRVKRADGEWETLNPRRKDTGDPELDALWHLSLDELEGVLDDPSDPRHEKAQRVTKEMVEPLRRAADAMLAPAMEHLRESVKRIAGNLIPPAALRTDDETWLKAIQPLEVAPPPDVDLYDIRPDTTAESVAAATESLAAAIQEQQELDRAAREQDRKERQDERTEARRNHRVMLGWTIGGVVVTAIATIVAITTSMGAASRPPRTTPAACGEIAAAWKEREAVAESPGRANETVLASRTEMLDRWAAVLDGAPEWTVEVVTSARDAFTDAVSGDVFTTERASSYSAAVAYLTTFVEECQSEGNLPDTYELD